MSDTIIESFRITLWIAKRLRENNKQLVEACEGLLQGVDDCWAEKEQGKKIIALAKAAIAAAEVKK